MKNTINELLNKIEESLELQSELTQGQNILERALYNSEDYQLDFPLFRFLRNDYIDDILETLREFNIKKFATLDESSNYFNKMGKLLKEGYNVSDLIEVKDNTRRRPSIEQALVFEMK